MRIMGAAVAALFIMAAVLPTKAHARAADSIELLSYDELMSMPESRREQYLMGLRELLTDLAKLDKPNLKSLFADESSQTLIERYAELIAIWTPVSSAETLDEKIAKVRDLQKASADANREYEMAQTAYNGYSSLNVFNRAARQAAYDRMVAAQTEYKKANRAWQRSRENVDSLVKASDAKRATELNNSSLERQRKEREAAVAERESTAKALESKQAAAQALRERVDSGELVGAQAQQQLKAAEAEATQAAKSATDAHVQAQTAKQFEDDLASRKAPLAKAQTDARKAASVGDVRKTEDKNLKAANEADKASDAAREKAEAEAAAKKSAQESDSKAALDAAMTGAPEVKGGEKALLTGKELNAPAKPAAKISGADANDLKCADYGDIPKEQQQALRKRLATNKKGAAALKNCNVGGFFSTYKGGRGGSQSKCQEQYNFCFSRGDCSIGSKPVKCAEAGKALCDPLTYGVNKSDSSPFCTKPNATMSADCDKLSSPDKRSYDFFKDKPGVREKWAEKKAKFEEMCEPKDLSKEKAYDVQIVNCGACRLIKKRLPELNKLVDGIKAPAKPTATGTQTSPVAR